MTYAPIAYMPYRCPKQRASIHVPLAHFGVARGVARDIGIMQTRVTQGAALALAEPLTAQIDPKVLLGHINANTDVEAAVKLLIGRFGPIPRNSHAYAVTGDYQPALFDVVITALRRNGFNVEIDFHQGQCVDFAMDLGSGRPLHSSCLRELPHYKPDRNQEREHAAFLTDRRATKPPIQMAFNLSSEMPKGYGRTASLPAPSVACMPQPR